MFNHLLIGGRVTTIGIDHNQFYKSFRLMFNTKHVFKLNKTNFGKFMSNFVTFSRLEDNITGAIND